MNNNQIEIQFHQGLALHQQGGLEKAKAIYEAILRVNPAHFNALQLLGVIYLEEKQYIKAIDLITMAIKIQSNQAPCFYNLGNAYLALSRYEDAITCYDKAIVLSPNFSQAFFNRARALEELQLFDVAILGYDRAIMCDGSYAEAYLSRGNLYHRLRRMEEAIRDYNQAIAIKSDFAIAHHDRGVALQELQRLNEAVESYDKAIAIRGDYADAYCNRGYALQELQQLEGAIASYKKAISINGNYPEAYWNLSLCQLQLGDFDEGWRGFEWRWKIQDTSKTAGSRSFKQKLWLGDESLIGKTILLHAEQGYGDSIQFCRFAKSVSQLGANVILEVQPSLVNLLQGIEGVNQVVARGDQLPDFDYQCPLMSLPLALQIHLESIPEPPKNLIIKIESREKWGDIIKKDAHYSVGLVWSGASTHKNDFYRSIPLSQFISALPSGIEYICLQNEIREADQKLLNRFEGIKNVSSSIKDFSDTAAICDLVDLVISVDTSVAHLSATIGRPTWLLLPYNADWRWLANREDSPWYSSLKIYRQPKLGDWGPVLEQVHADLIDFQNKNI